MTAPYAASFMPMTAKAQRTAGKRERFTRGLFQVSNFSAGAVVGEGSVSLRSCELASSFKLRPPMLDGVCVETVGLSCLSRTGCISMGSSSTAVEEPPLRCSKLMLVASSCECLMRLSSRSADQVESVVMSSQLQKKKND